ncbi:MAG: RHS repeat-associated core domain-containing protein [Terriglobia bacterium]
MGASIANNRNPDRSQSFTYNAVNRIDTAVTAEWSQDFDTDIWGNLHTITAVNAPALSVSFTGKKNNRIDQFCYDAAGNLTHQGACPGSTYTYNAENRMTATGGVNYTYDGDGRRVMKDNGKLYWYGVSGEVLTESDAVGTITDEFIFFGGRRVARRHSAGNVFYYFEDHLGTSRIITDASGSPCYDADFYPFGGERVYLDTCPQPYKFTGRERDAESGLDYFGARYYASTLARFTSPDPINFHIGRAANPQRLNIYSYVINNPLRYVDAFGLELWRVIVGDQSVVVDKSVAPQVANFLRDVNREGIRVEISSGYRTRAEQQDLIAKKSSNNYPVGGEDTSPHRGGQAIDLRMATLWRQNPVHYFEVVFISMSYNKLGWGGFWKDPDEVHFGATIADPTLRAENDANPTPTRNIIPGTTVAVEATAPVLQPEEVPIQAGLTTTASSPVLPRLTTYSDIPVTSNHPQLGQVIVIEGLELTDWLGRRRRFRGLPRSVH